MSSDCGHIDSSPNMESHQAFCLRAPRLVINDWASQLLVVLDISDENEVLISSSINMIYAYLWSHPTIWTLPCLLLNAWFYMKHVLDENIINCHSWEHVKVDYLNSIKKNSINNFTFVTVHKLTILHPQNKKKELSVFFKPYNNIISHHVIRPGDVSENRAPHIIQINIRFKGIHLWAILQEIFRILIATMQSSDCVTSLGPSDTIWWQRSMPTIAQVMACCLMAPSHNLKQYWLLINKVQGHSSESNFTVSD